MNGRILKRGGAVLLAGLLLAGAAASQIDGEEGEVGMTSGGQVVNGGRGVSTNPPQVSPPINNGGQGREPGGPDVTVEVLEESGWVAKGGDEEESVVLRVGGVRPGERYAVVAVARDRSAVEVLAVGRAPSTGEVELRVRLKARPDELDGVAFVVLTKG